MLLGQDAVSTIDGPAAAGPCLGRAGRHGWVSAAPSGWASVMHRFRTLALQLEPAQRRFGAEALHTMPRMSPERESGPRATGSWLRRVPSLPLVPWLAVALGAAAIVAAIFAGHSQLPGLLAALAMLLMAAACTLAGALWQGPKLVARLAEARQQQQLLLQLIDVWVWQTDAEHRLVRLQPPQSAAASCWAAGAFSGQLLWERFIDAQAELLPRMQAQVALPELNVRAAADATRTWRLRGLPRHDHQGRFAGYLGVLQTAATAVVVDPGHAEAQAAEHSAFSYTISHDLRAPLRVVEGFGRILKEDYGSALDRIGNDHLDRMVAAAARMNHMIDALLALAQLSVQPLLRQPVNLSQLAQYVIDDLRRAAPERQVAVHIQPGLLVRGDPTLLRLVLDNLLGNAWKYSARRSDAEIRFEQVEHDGRRVLLVRDNGAGFDMRFADRLFGAFQRLHSSSEFQGTGVGLASVRRIVRRHGGEVWAESEVGGGARFYFTLGD